MQMIIANDIISFAESTVTDLSTNLALSQTDVNKIVSKFDRTSEKGKVDKSLIYIEILCNLLEKQMLEKQYLGFGKEFDVLFRVKHLLSQGVNYNRKLLLQSAFEELLYKEQDEV